MLRNQDRPMIAFVLQSARKKDFAIAKVKEGAAGGQMLRLNRNYDDKRFSILAAARSSCHLNLLEATYIKTRRPGLCRQKEFVYTLKLFR